jgi:hypothetical protein
MRVRGSVYMDAVAMCVGLGLLAGLLLIVADVLKDYE